MRAPYREAIQRAALAPQLDALFVEAIVMQESAGRADAFRFEAGYYDLYLKGKPEWADWEPRRVASSYGLMQVLYPTAVETGWRGEPEELFQIAVNLQVGCAVLAGLMRLFDANLAKVAAAYNGGPGGFTGLAAQSYSRLVLARYQQLVSVAVRG